MNPTSVASNFSVQKISAHHYLIRGDNGIADYMKFCDTKWSNTYSGWIVHENEEVDLLQMHIEVLDSLKIKRKELSKEKNKKAITNKRHTKDTKDVKKKVSKDIKKKDSKKKESKYTRMKRGEDISDDEDDDDDYIPSTEPSSEEDDESEDIEETSDEEEEEETDKTRKKEYQFYKKEILAYGYMTERQQEKLNAIWNKFLKGWLVPKSYLEKLQKYGWIEVDDVEEVKPKKESEKKVVVNVPVPVTVKKTIVHNPMVKKKVIQEEPKTFENYKNMLLAKGKMTLVESANIQAIFHPGMKAYLVFPEFKTQLVELGFKDITPVQEQDVKVVKISFTEGNKLDIKNIE